MPVKQSHYEALLSAYSDRAAAIALLRQHRPYLEMLPSLRRANESIITIPLPVAKIRSSQQASPKNRDLTCQVEAIRLDCDLAILMCDPEWKIKMGVEILIFIHRPQEDFSGLLGRWRQTQVWLNKDYKWLMPLQDQHVLSEGAEKAYPLFVVFAQTPERIKQGLLGACLPFVTQTPGLFSEEQTTEALFSES